MMTSYRVSLATSTNDTETLFEGTLADAKLELRLTVWHRLNQALIETGIASLEPTFKVRTALKSMTAARLLACGDAVIYGHFSDGQHLTIQAIV